MSTIEHTDTSVLGALPLWRRISELMVEKGEAFSIRAFAPRIGFSREILRRMLAGERHITPSDMERIAKGLGVSIERLKHVDTFSKQKELSSLLNANIRTKSMMLHAHSIAVELVDVARGATERGYCLNNLGRVQFMQQKYDEAHETWMSALEYAKQIQEQYEDKQLLHLVTVNLMLSYSIRKEYSNIEEFLSLVEKVFFDDPEKLGVAYYTRMKWQEERGNIKLAKNYAYLSLEQFVQTNVIEQICKAKVNVAHYEYLLGNYDISKELLSEVIDQASSFEFVLIHTVKEYVKSLLQLQEYETAIRIIEEYSLKAKDYPEYWAKLQIMYTVATDSPSYAETVINNSDISLQVRYLACKCLMEYFYLKRDFDLAMRYYEKGRMFSNTKSEFLNEGGF